jgi:hypothetical protein
MLWQINTAVPSDGPRIDDVREAIHANRIVFPVPVPTFPAQFRPEIQWRLVELYFIRGWSSAKLAERYGVTARRIQQSLQQWVGIALSRGYLQEIPPEAPFLYSPASPPMMAAAAMPRFSPIPPPTVPELAAMRQA